MKVQHYKQEKEYTCGPATMRMVLKSFGITRSEKQLSKILKTEKRQWTPFKDLAIVPKKFNLKYVEKENSSISELRKLMEQKYKIIVCHLDLQDHIRLGHYSVVKKIDKNKIYFLDPYYGPNQKFSINYFRKIWKSTDKQNRTNKWFIAVK
jgi:ABC-type bacteriocin/lantibiotic exporter with double-glycine peptidase domain